MTKINLDEINYKGGDVMSGLNKHFICNYCKAAYTKKIEILKHLKTKSCRVGLVCGWCKIKFKNRGNLAQHAFHVHGDSSYRVTKVSDYNIKCEVCEKKLPYRWLLKYHIRQQHFNLKAKTPYCELKKVNQVWFEKVLNSNNVMEIKKTGHSKLLMRKLGPNTAIKVMDHNTETVDLTSLYPTDRSDKKTQCTSCQRMYIKRDYKKHIEEFHMKLTKYRCNNCNATFQRVYKYIKHVCSKRKWVKGVKQIAKDMRIASVESLAIPL